MLEHRSQFTNVMLMLFI